MTVHAVVAGGAGFLGSHLVDALLGKGWRVTVIDDLSSGSLENLTNPRPGLDVQIADICDRWSVRGKVNLIFNFASPASPQQYLQRPLQTLAASSVGVQKLIELALAKSARFVHASTSEVYGDPQVTPQAESYWGNVNPIGPRSCYDEAKRFAEALIVAHVRTSALNAGIVRIFNTYGPRLAPSDGRVVSNFIRQALTGEPLTIYGRGSQTRSFCYVDDLIRGVLAMAEPDGPMGPINLGNPRETSIADLAALVADLTGTSKCLVVHHDLPADDPVRRRSDISQAERLLGWRPCIDLEEGMTRTIAWFRHCVLDRTRPVRN